jgi:hypothetical protein
LNDYAQLLTEIQFKPNVKLVLEKATFDLLWHFESYQIDPSNILIGRPPSNTIIESSNPLSTLEDNIKNEKSKKHIEKNDFEKEFVTCLQRWSFLKSYPKRIEKEIELLLDKVDNDVIPKGQLIIVNLLGLPSSIR